MALSGVNAQAAKRTQGAPWSWSALLEIAGISAGHTTQIKLKGTEMTINIDDLTIGEAKRIAAIFGAGQAPSEQGLNGLVGKKCIVRTYSAGVWFGEVEQKSGSEVIVKNARRLWRWKAAESISLSAVAIHGVNASQSKITEAVPHVWLEAIELIPATGKAIQSIEGAPNVAAE